MLLGPCETLLELQGGLQGMALREQVLFHGCLCRHRGFQTFNCHSFQSGLHGVELPFTILHSFTTCQNPTAGQSFRYESPHGPTQRHTGKECLGEAPFMTIQGILMTQSLLSYIHYGDI